MTAESTDTSFIWPARHAAGTSSNPDLPPMGARFRLKASYNISGYSPQAQVVLRAMQQYGLILADNGSNWYFGGTADPAWPSALVNELKAVPASAFEAVDESSLMVDPNSGQARQIGGPVTCSTAPGYRLAAADGGVFSFCAPFYGSMGGHTLNQPIVGMAATPDGKGYWLVAADGGIFTFGDAGFYGSTGNLHLNQPIVGMAATPDGKGYWLVAADGGIFTFGDAGFYGSTGNLHLNQPIVGMAADPRRQGLLAGGRGRGHLHLRRRRLLRLDRGPAPQPAHRGHGRRPPTAGGYWLVAKDGGIFTFGDAPFDGSAGSLAPQRSPSWAWPPRPTAAATGWWRPTGASSPSATPPSRAPPDRMAWWHPLWPPRAERPRAAADELVAPRLSLSAGVGASAGRRWSRGGRNPGAGRGGWLPRVRGARSGPPCGHPAPGRGRVRPSTSALATPAPRASSSTTTSSIQARTPVGSMKMAKVSMPTTWASPPPLRRHQERGGGVVDDAAQLLDGGWRGRRRELRDQPGRRRPAAASAVSPPRTVSDRPRSSDLLGVAPPHRLAHAVVEDVPVLARQRGEDDVAPALGPDDRRGHGVAGEPADVAALEGMRVPTCPRWRGSRTGASRAAPG